MPDTIPNFWSYKSPITAKKDVLMFIPVFGPSQTRGFGDGKPIHEWEIGNDDSGLDNFIELKEFWDEHYPGVSFYMYDPQLNETRTYEITSDLAEQYNAGEGVAWSMRIREIFPYTATPGTPPG